MEIRGKVHNGVVVLDGEESLPEGMAVVVSYPVPALEPPPESLRRVPWPLVPSDRPGTRTLTADRIAEILDDD